MHQKPGVKSGAPEGSAFPAPYILTVLGKNFVWLILCITIGVSGFIVKMIIRGNKLLKSIMHCFIISQLIEYYCHTTANIVIAYP